MMNEKIFVVETVEITDCDTDVSRIAKVITDTKETYSYEDLEEIVDKLNEQQAIIEELKTHNLQHFLEWLVIKGYVTDEPLKDINNVIDCVNKFKEYLTELDTFKEWLGVLEDE